MQFIIKANLILVGGGGGTEVIPNPQDTPTDTLETISIDGTVYNIEGSGSDGASYGYLDPNANFGADKDIYIKYIGDNVISEWMNGGSFKPPTQHATYDIENSFGRDISNDYEIKIINVTIGSWTILVSDITTSWTIKEGSWDTGFSGIRINPSTNRYELHTDYSTPHTLQYKTNDFKPISIDSIWHKTDETWHKDNSSKVIANPEDAATDTLTKLSVDGDVYEIPEINVEDVYINGTSALDENNIAQIKSYKEITKAEYDALPASKLTDDILYCITDGGATEPGEYFNPVIYSTTEREIGVWTDGKPLYQKSIVLTSAVTLQSGSWVDIATVENVANVVRVELNRNGDDAFTVMGVASNNKVRAQSTTTLTCNAGSTFTFWYTKTTDTPGSGKYTTLGVPSVHYSTDEQVVGTWIDGKPLYQKTIHTSGISMRLNGTYDFTSLFPLTNTVRDITVIGNYQDNDGPNYFSLGQYCLYFNPSETPAHTLRLNAGSSTRTFEFFITIKYTKTTD